MKFWLVKFDYWLLVLIFKQEHKKTAERQRKCYNYQRKSLDILKDKILIELDFKQKIVVGLSPRQINREYYELEQRTCLGK